ncbi:MAG: hypothetical protein K6L81_14325 [Agarilytica sp.]
MKRFILLVLTIFLYGCPCEFDRGNSACNEDEDEYEMELTTAEVGVYQCYSSPASIAETHEILSQNGIDVISTRCADLIERIPTPEDRICQHYGSNGTIRADYFSSIEIFEIYDSNKEDLLNIDLNGFTMLNEFENNHVEKSCE